MQEVDTVMVCFIQHIKQDQTLTLLDSRGVCLTIFFQPHFLLQILT